MAELRVSFACNDPESGADRKRFDRIKFSDVRGCLVELEGPDVRVQFGLVTVYVGDSRFTMSGYTRWCGNWCWDSALLTVVDSRALLSLLLSKGWQWIERRDESPLSDLLNEGDEV